MPYISSPWGTGYRAPQSLERAIKALFPIGYWKLDDASGTTAFDSSGNGRHGTYSGGYTLRGVAGKDRRDYATFGAAAGGVVTIADNDVWGVMNTPDLTVFALIKPTSVAGTTRQFIVSKGNTSNYEWGFNINDAAAARLENEVWTAAGLVNVSSHCNSIITTDWQAVAANLPGNNISRNQYRNSITLTRDGGVTNNLTLANGTAALTIGWRGDSAASQYFVGGIAHVAIWSGGLVDLTTVNNAARADGWF